MFTHIRMKNFKSWKDSGEVKLAPLTVFFGTNSSGKSSLLQMLLLLKQTIGTEEIIFFGDDNSLVNLGNFREVIHEHKESELLDLELGCKLQETLEIRISQESNRIHHGSVVYDGIRDFNFKTILSKKEGKLNIETLHYRPPQCSLKRVPHQVDVFFNGKAIGPATEIKNCYGVPVSEKSILGHVLQQFSSSFEKLFTYIYYLGPTRVRPQRNFRWEGTHPKSIGHFGDKAIDALLSSRVDQLTTSHASKEVPIEERISAWLQDMDLTYSFSLERTEQDYEVRIQRSPDSAEVTLADMGYGLSQFLPVLVLCYYAPEGSTLILEQPGMHLHPKVQSELADLLIDVVTERNLQVLVESHSEHLLNRLQRRVAEEKIDADQTAVYFCQNDEGVSTIEHLEMDEFGNIKNWPPNFFGDEIGDLFAMTEAQMERQKRAEE